VTEECDNLPRGWDYECLGQLGVWSGGGTPSKANYAYWTNGTIPWVSPKDMKSERIRSSEDLITEEATQRTPAKPVPPGSVLMVTRSGILAHTFPVAVTERVVAINQDLKSLTPYEGIDANFVAWYLRYRSSAILAECAKHGTTVASIEMDRLRKLRVPIAPAKEQRRIVEKIEALFAELDKGEESLRQVQKLLARYRQSVLKAAVTGELTADWRARHAGKLEHGRDLLARILKARREKWQGRGRYVEPAEPDTRNLPKLPDGWVWSSLGQLIVTIEAGKNVRCEERPPRAAEVGIVKVSAVTWGEFDELQSKTITDPSYVSPSLRIQEGDLLISRANTLELVGASVVVGPVQRHLQLSDKVLRLRCAYPLEHWLNITLRSALGRAQIQAFATGAQLSMRNISQENMQRIAVPLPPPEEINLLVAKTALLQAQEKEMLSVVLDTMKRSGVLRQTILKDAFSGRLVPQDPNDEPAAELLARIRAQRAMESRKTARRMATA